MPSHDHQEGAGRNPCMVIFDLPVVMAEMQVATVDLASGLRGS